MCKLRKLIIATIIYCMLMTNPIFAVDSANVNILPYIDVAVGYSYSAVLKSDGTVWTWGYNNKGQLGIGSQDDSSNLVQVSNITDVVSIAASKDYMMALKSDGTVWAWGNNKYGQLGNNSTTLSTVPVQVKINDTDYLTNITYIDVGEAHSIALKSDGTVWTWGCNSGGRLGNGNQAHSSVAIQVASLSSIVSIDAGGEHSLAVTSDGTVMSWGYNGYGQLGIDSTKNSLVPVAVPSLSNIIALDSGANHSLALSSDGTVYGWGRNDYGQLGTSDYVARILEPKQLLTGAEYISVGENVSFVKFTEGETRATGYNYYGQLGINELYEVKLNNYYITEITDVNQISVGAKHVLALKNDGSLWGWGDNSYASIDNTNTIKKGLPGLINNPLNDEIASDAQGTSDGMASDVVENDTKTEIENTQGQTNTENNQVTAETEIKKNLGNVQNRVDTTPSGSDKNAKYDNVTEQAPGRWSTHIKGLGNDGKIYNYHINFIAEIAVGYKDENLPDWYKSLGDNVTATMMGYTLTLGGAEVSNQTMIRFKGDKDYLWFNGGNMVENRTDSAQNIKAISYNSLISFDGTTLTGNTLDYDTITAVMRFSKDSKMKIESVTLELGTMNVDADYDEFKLIGGGMLYEEIY